jgi:hypothetical protein
MDLILRPLPLLEPVQAGGFSSPSPNHGCTISDDKKIAWTRYERKEIYPLQTIKLELDVILRS